MTAFRKGDRVRITDGDAPRDAPADAVYIIGAIKRFSGATAFLLGDYGCGWGWGWDGEECMVLAREFGKSHGWLHRLRGLEKVLMGEGGIDMTTKRQEATQTWELIKLVLQHSRRVLFYGPPGTGKTYAAVHGGKDKRPTYTVTVTDDMSAAELRGHYIPEGDKFTWHDGVAIKAWREGARLVINEIDRASGDIEVLLHAILDDEATAVLTLPTGETVRPEAGFAVIATMNGQPEDLESALRDRFPVMIEVSEPNPEAIQQLPEDLRDVAAKTVDVPEARRLTLRAWMEFARLRPVVGEGVAAEAVFGPRSKDVLDALAMRKAQKEG